MKSVTPIILAVAIGIGCIVRFAAVFYALPLDVMGDEFGHIATALSFLNEKTLVATHEFSYAPSLMAVLLTPFLGLYGVFGIAVGWFANLDAFKEFAILNSSLFIASVRVLSGLCGVAFLWFLYLFSRRLANRDIALFAVLFAAFDFWLVHESQVGHLWMPMTALLMAAFYTLLRVSETGALRWYLLSALCIALGFWAGYIPILLLLWLPVAHGFAPSRRFRNLLWGEGLAVLLIASISFLNPYSFVRQFGRALRTLFEIIGISVFPNLPHSDEIAVTLSQKFTLLAHTLFFDNPFLLLLGVIGLVLFIYRRGFRSFPTLLLGGFSVCYILVFLFAWPGPDNRYVLPLFPAIFFGAAYAVAATFEKKNTILKVAAAGLLVCGVSWGVLATISYTKLLFHEDTRHAARAWVMDHVPADASVLISAKYFELPRNPSVTEYLFAHEPSALRTRDRYLLDNKNSFSSPSYFVLSAEEVGALLGSDTPEFSYIVRSWYLPAEEYPIPAGYTLVATFYPHAPIVPLTDELLQNPDNPFTSLLLVGNLGPYVEVYEKAK